MNGAAAIYLASLYLVRSYLLGQVSTTAIHSQPVSLLIVLVQQRERRLDDKHPTLHAQAHCAQVFIVKLRRPCPLISPHHRQRWQHTDCLGGVPDHAVRRDVVPAGPIDHIIYMIINVMYSSMIAAHHSTVQSSEQYSEQYPARRVRGADQCSSVIVRGHTVHVYAVVTHTRNSTHMHSGSSS